MKMLVKSLLIVLSLAVSTVYASALTAPKSQGIIGERFDGYVGIVKKPASAKIKTLVDTVNQKRKSRYKEIAVKRQQALSKVEIIAGESAIKKTKPGNYIFLKGVGWKKK